MHLPNYKIFKCYFALLVLILNLFDHVYSTFQQNRFVGSAAKISFAPELTELPFPQELPVVPDF